MSEQPASLDAQQGSSTSDFVGRTIAHLQAGYLRYPQSPAARAALAQLRRGVGREMGALAELLPYVVNPGAPATQSADVTRDEAAIYTAMTLYAVHQQSRDRPMHVRGVSFGSALGRLRYADGAESPGVVARFQAMGTASGLTELSHHARALITLLRSANRGFDYGRFAGDLVRFQDPRRADAVRLSWGRDFYRVAPSDALADAATDATTDATEEKP